MGRGFGVEFRDDGQKIVGEEGLKEMGGGEELLESLDAVGDQPVVLQELHALGVREFRGDNVIRVDRLPSWFRLGDGFGIRRNQGGGQKRHRLEVEPKRWWCRI